MSGEKTEIRDRDTHIKMVRDEENTDIFGDKGNFCIKPEFNVAILAKWRDEDACKELIENIPHGKEMALYAFE